MTINFHQALIQYISPRLMLLDYQLHQGLREDNWIWGFSKHLGSDIQSIILFQLNQDDAVNSFTVNLIRCKVSDPSKWHQGNYEGFINIRLGELLRDVLGLRIYPIPDHWWEIIDNEFGSNLKQLLDDVADKLEYYGIPWLEETLSDASGVSIGLWNEFQTSVFETVPEYFLKAAYEIRTHKLIDWLPPQTLPQYYFQKNFSDNLSGFIIFYPIYFMPNSLQKHKDDLTDKPTVYFDVQLFRKRSNDPYDQNFVADRDAFQIWFSKYLAVTFGIRRTDPRPYWKYTDRDELTSQLDDAAKKILTYGLPKLERFS